MNSLFQTMRIYLVIVRIGLDTSSHLKPSLHSALMTPVVSPRPQAEISRSPSSRAAILAVCLKSGKMPLPLYMAFRAPSGLRKRGRIGLDTSPCPRGHWPSFIEPLCVELPLWRFFRKSGKMPLPLYMAFRAPSGLRKRGRLRSNRLKAYVTSYGCLACLKDVSLA